MSSSFNQQTTIGTEDAYVTFLGKQSQKPLAYRFNFQYQASCPINTLPSTSECRGFAVGKDAIDSSTALRARPTTLNEVDQRRLQTELLRTAPFKAGDFDVSTVTTESLLRSAVATNPRAPNRVLTERPYDRFEFVDAPLGVEAQHRYGESTRFTPVRHGK